MNLVPTELITKNMFPLREVSVVRQSMLCSHGVRHMRDFGNPQNVNMTFGAEIGYNSFRFVFT